MRFKLGILTNSKTFFLAVLADFLQTGPSHMLKKLSKGIFSGVLSSMPSFIAYHVHSWMAISCTNRIWLDLAFGFVSKRSRDLDMRLLFCYRRLENLAEILRCPIRSVHAVVALSSLNLRNAHPPWIPVFKATCKQQSQLHLQFHS